MEPRDHRRGIAERPHEVQREIGRHRAPGRRRNDLCRDASGVVAALQPLKECVGVAHRRGQPDPLQGTAREVRQPLQDRQEVPTTIIAGERVDLVHDHSTDVPQQDIGIQRG